MSTAGVKPKWEPCARCVALGLLITHSTDPARYPDLAWIPQRVAATINPEIASQNLDLCFEQCPDDLLDFEAASLSPANLHRNRIYVFEKTTFEFSSDAFR